MSRGLENMLLKIKVRPDGTLIARYLALVAELDDLQEKSARALALAQAILPAVPGEALRIAHMVHRTDTTNIQAYDVMIAALTARGRYAKAEVIALEKARVMQEAVRPTAHLTADELASMAAANADATGYTGQDDATEPDQNAFAGEDRVNPNLQLAAYLPLRGPPGAARKPLAQRLFAMIGRDGPSGREERDESSAAAADGESGAPVHGETAAFDQLAAQHAQEMRQGQATPGGSPNQQPAAGAAPRRERYQEPLLDLDLRDEDTGLAAPPPVKAAASAPEAKAAKSPKASPPMLDLGDLTGGDLSSLAHAGSSRGKARSAKPKLKAKSKAAKLAAFGREIIRAPEQGMQRGSVPDARQLMTSPPQASAPAAPTQPAMGRDEVAKASAQAAPPLFVLPTMPVGSLQPEPARAAEPPPLSRESFWEPIHRQLGRLGGGGMTAGDAKPALTTQAARVLALQERLAANGQGKEIPDTFIQALLGVHRERASGGDAHLALAITWDLLQALWGENPDANCAELIELMGLQHETPGLWGLYLDALLASGSGRKAFTEVRRFLSARPQLTWARVAWRRLPKIWQAAGVRGFSWNEDQGVAALVAGLQQRGAPRLTALPL